MNNKHTKIITNLLLFILFLLTFHPFHAYGDDQVVLSTLDHGYLSAPLKVSVKWKKVDETLWIDLSSQVPSLGFVRLNTDLHNDFHAYEARLGLPRDMEFYVMGAFGVSTKKSELESTSLSFFSGTTSSKKTVNEVSEGPTDPSLGLRKRFEIGEDSRSGVLLEGNYSPSFGTAHSVSSASKGNNYRGGNLWYLEVGGYKKFKIWDLKLSARYAEHGASTRTEAGTSNEINETRFSSYSYGIFNRWTLFETVALDLGLSSENFGPSTSLSKGSGGVVKRSSLSLTALNLGVRWSIRQLVQLSYDFAYAGAGTPTKLDGYSATLNGTTTDFTSRIVSSLSSSLALQVYF